MKKLLLLLLLIGCKKEIIIKPELQESTRAQGSQTTFWYTGNTSSMGDKGMSANADVVKFKVGNQTMKSWWIAFYFTDTAGKSKWTQWGYGTHKSLGNITIISTWEFPPSGYQVQISPPTTHLNTVPLNYGGRSTFSIYNVDGTTKWRYARDGIDIEEVDLEATSMSGKTQVMIETQASSPGSFNLINVKNISSLTNGVWTNAASGQPEGTGINGTFVYPIEGQNQNPALSKAEINMGGSVSTAPYFSYLWN